MGGLEDVKQRLKEAVEWPFKNPEVLSRLGAKPPKGKCNTVQPLQGFLHTWLARTAGLASCSHFTVQMQVYKLLVTVACGALHAGLFRGVF